jgi:hypothetical protein
MAHSRKSPDEKFDHQIIGLFTKAEAQEITDYAGHLGISKAAALRILVRRGLRAPGNSPFTPAEGDKKP